MRRAALPAAAATGAHHASLCARCPPVASQLSISAIVVQDLRQKRGRDYTFDWSRMLQAEGDTGTSVLLASAKTLLRPGCSPYCCCPHPGVLLQYTHARLCSLEMRYRDEAGLSEETPLQDAVDVCY